MAKRAVKSLVVSSIVLAMVACTNSVPNNTPVAKTENFQDLDQEYQFTTKELTQSYLKRKLEKWLGLPCDALAESVGVRAVSNCGNVNGTKLVKEIAYAKYKHPTTFCAVINEDPGQNLLNDINAITEVSDRRTIDPAFGEFIDSCSSAVPFDFLVNTFTTDGQVFPSVAMDSTGDYVITWHSYNQDGSSSGVYAQMFDVNGNRVLPAGCAEPDCNTSTGEFLVNTDTNLIQDRARVAMDHNGNFVVTWENFNFEASNWEVKAQLFNSNGSKKGSEFPVNTYTTSYQHSPTTAMDSDGDFVIAWQSGYQDGSFGGIYAKKFDSNGAFIVPPACSLPGCDPVTGEFLVNTTTVGWQFQPSSAMDENGNFVIGWEGDAPNQDRNIYVQKYFSNGSREGGEILVNDYTEGSQHNVSVAMDSNGDFIVAWNGNGYDGYQLYGKKYNTDGSHTGDFKINSGTGINPDVPKVAMDNTGDFVVTWVSYGVNSSGDIRGQRYDSNAVKVEGEFRVNNFTTFNQYYPAVGMDSDGDFVIAWQSYYQENYSPGVIDYYGYYGVYARRYFSSRPNE
jgi:hypothetical protein